MQVTTTFRHMEQSDALKSYAEEKLDRVAKYIDEPINVQVYFAVEKKIRHIVEIVIAAKGISTKASEATNDMYAAVDAVIDKIERQLKRYKEKIKAHKPNGDDRGRPRLRHHLRSVPVGRPTGSRTRRRPWLVSRQGCLPRSCR